MEAVADVKNHTASPEHPVIKPDLSPVLQQDPLSGNKTLDNGAPAQTMKTDTEVKVELKSNDIKAEVIIDKKAGATNNKNDSKPIEPKKQSREEKYSKKKDERSVEQILRSLSGIESPQEKLNTVCKKYSETTDENRKLQLQLKNMERRLAQVEREKDSAQSEHSKAVLTRSRLEGLCRELQRQNKAIKEESLLKIREEEEKRKEVSNKFQSTLAEINSLMQQNNEKNNKLKDDNTEMSTKFKSVCEQYELRVQQVEKISKQMSLEAQLSEAKLAKARLEATAEKEVLLREKQELLVNLAQYQARCQELQQTEIDLRAQIELYTEKYEEFQNALSRSNQVFGDFKGEMDKMSKKIVKLEKETSTWKQRWEKSHQALLQMAADKQQRDAELALANRQSAQLHKLCRTLTEERAKLMAQINSAGTPIDNEKQEKQTADLAEDRQKLNNILDNLQSAILERELLHKQQQLEKQQEELQLELLKHQTQSSTSKTDAPTPAQNSSKAADKKKGKKQKNGRSSQETSSPVSSTTNSSGGSLATSPSKTASESKTSEKPSSTKAEEKPIETKETVAKESPPETVNVKEEKSGSHIPSNETICDSKPAPQPKEEAVVSTTSSPTPVLPQAPAPAPAVFSYAAALGSKPTEQAQTEPAQAHTAQEGGVKQTADKIEVKAPEEPDAKPSVGEQPNTVPPNDSPVHTSSTSSVEQQSSEAVVAATPEVEPTATPVSAAEAAPAPAPALAPTPRPKEPTTLSAEVSAADSSQAPTLTGNVSPRQDKVI